MLKVAPCQHHEPPRGAQAVVSQQCSSAMLLASLAAGIISNLLASAAADHVSRRAAWQHHAGILHCATTQLWVHSTIFPGAQRLIECNARSWLRNSSVHMGQGASTTRTSCHGVLGVMAAVSCKCRCRMDITFLPIPTPTRLQAFHVALINRGLQLTAGVLPGVP